MHECGISGRACVNSFVWGILRRKTRNMSLSTAGVRSDQKRMCLSELQMHECGSSGCLCDNASLWGILTRRDEECVSVSAYLRINAYVRW